MSFTSVFNHLRNDERLYIIARDNTVNMQYNAGFIITLACRIVGNNLSNPITFSYFDSAPQCVR
jgi:hypothetical protein